MILNSGASSPDEIVQQIDLLTHAKVHEIVDDAACIKGDRYTEAVWHVLHVLLHVGGVAADCISSPGGSPACCLRCLLKVCPCKTEAKP